MLKKISGQKFVFTERQLTELDNLVFVAMVTNLPWKQRKVQLQFRSLGSMYQTSLQHSQYLNYLQLCCENASIIPRNLVFKQ